MRTKKPRPRIARQITRRLDDALGHVKLPARPDKGWIRTIREALGMTQAQLGRRMGISRQAVTAMENAELDGSLTLARLQRAAEALGCEPKYVLLPRKPLEQMISEQAQRRAAQKLDRVNRSQALEASEVRDDALSIAVQDLARELELQRAPDLWDE